MKIGMIFPGQGSQYLGMGKDFYDEHRRVQELFEEASNCLDQNFVRLCFASSEKELQQTINSQTSIFLVSTAIYTVLKEKYGIIPDLVAGHSLGEYSAIFAAKGISFPDALYLIKKRSSFMEKVTTEHRGGMIAVLGLPNGEVLKQICKRYDKPDDITAVAQVVNFNTPTQFVVSGTLSELEQISLDVKALNAKVLPVNVAGAFHSRLMSKAEEDFNRYMVKVDFKKLEIPLVNNVESNLITEADDLKNSLVKQMSSPILWWHSMQKFADIDIIIQVGPGNKLARMLSREWPDKKIITINKPEDIEDLFNLLARKMPVNLEDTNNISKKEEKSLNKQVIKNDIKNDQVSL